jgi:predicted O-methyltransferase YrrM
MSRAVFVLMTVVGCAALCGTHGPMTASTDAGLDARVTAVLEQKRGTWRDMNVSEADGRALHDLILRHRFVRALEVGTSTGHSGLWIGWALAKTGGRLITIDIDESRHTEAVATFRAAGLDGVIDARLADAHALVPQLPGPFDFVFIDADKDWYINYAKAVLPKLNVGGALTAHNVYPGRRRGFGTGEFYEWVTGLPFMETTVINGGLAIGYKRKAP